MKLTNIRKRGRYVNPITGRAVNVHVGRNAQRGTDNLYFLRSGKRVFISDCEFGDWKTEYECILIKICEQLGYTDFIFNSPEEILNGIKKQCKETMDTLDPIEDYTEYMMNANCIKDINDQILKVM